RAHGSVILGASGQHLMTDVWTSVGAVAGVLLAQWTGFLRIDPIVALLIAALIVRTGFGIVRDAIQGLLDTALPTTTESELRAIIERELPPGTTYHALRTRASGAHQFADFHLLVPGRDTVAQAHDLANRIERAIDAHFPGLEATIHLEPIEDPAAWTDSVLVSIERAEGLAPVEDPPG
ncbi:MAG: cation diffusion facilitator family transporter, partial [Thermomicrobiales bacterium]|nr:cation diffusion facilitator family transporter [Thermomicrobiales bacterium]